MHSINTLKSARNVIGPLENKGMKGNVKEDRELAEKLNKFFASIFTIEDIEQKVN